MTKEEYEKEVEEFSSEKYEEAFNTGNWKYQSFNKLGFPSIQAIWDSKMEGIISSIFSYFEDIQYDKKLQEIEQLELSENLHGGFIESVKKVIEKIKSDDTFRCLKKVDSFKIYFLNFYDDLKKEKIVKRILNATHNV